MTNVIQPIIGIICGLDTDNQNYNLGRKYVDAIIEEAGLPILIPVGNDVVTIDSIMKLCDGLMFVGGSDVDPWYFSQEPQFPTKKIDPERDNFEIELIKSALRELKPLLDFLLQSIKLIINESQYLFFLAQFHFAPPTSIFWANS